MQPRHEHGTVRASDYWGVKDAHVREGGVPAPSGLATVDHRCKGLKGDGSRCVARPARGTRFCIGHLRSRGEA
jgi:hypothetical protein